MIDPLLAITPLDGRYRDRISSLEHYFSEYALIRYRIFVEIEWFIFLCNEVALPGSRILSDKEISILRELSTVFEAEDARRVKEIEHTTNHDVKAVEYFIREHLKAYPRIAELAHFIHFGATSEDINNVAYSLLLTDFINKEYVPLQSGLIAALRKLAKEHAGTPMLARTHGQPASPTTVGKEIANTLARLERQMRFFDKRKLPAKWSGAVGNFNAHSIAYPEIDWTSVSFRFITVLGLEPNMLTTQIEPHDGLAEVFDCCRRINTIHIDFCRDAWLYISQGYFLQKIMKGEVGSSTMPHKVNPIDFENAEGNLGLSNAVFTHLSEKLPVSRLQRDLSDSTVLRSIGVAYGYSMVAVRSLLQGLSKISVHKEKLAADLDENWEVLTEAVQTVLRAHGEGNAYEKLKELSRGKKLAQKELAAFIAQLKLPPRDKKRLLSLTPASYSGYAEKLTTNYLK